MSAELDFDSLPKQRVPRFVVSPRRVLGDMLSKNWIESAIPFLALLCVLAGVLLTTDGYFEATNLRNLPNTRPMAGWSYWRC
jgi:ribose transport system permease protein